MHETEDGKAASPTENLMREHGVFDRILLIYEAGSARLDRNEEFSPDILGSAAQIVRDFVENYHQQLEENFLFPRFEKANRHVELVRTLQHQHQVGRQITDRILQRANLESLRDPEQRAIITNAMQQFIVMYRPHTAREDTLLFPALREILSPGKYEELGEAFETRERDRFGKGGFAHFVTQVAEIEKTLEIDELSQSLPQT
jgi:hemerythrin-like domain-containing protein